MRDGIPWDCPEDEYLQKLRDRHERKRRMAISVEESYFPATSFSQPQPQMSSDVWGKIYPVHSSESGNDQDTDMSVNEVEDGMWMGELQYEEVIDDDDDLGSVPDWSEDQMRNMEVQAGEYLRMMNPGCQATVEEYDGDDDDEQPPENPRLPMLGPHQVTTAGGSALRDSPPPLQ